MRSGRAIRVVPSLMCGLILFASASAAGARDGGADPEMVVVFNKEVAGARCEQVLKQLGWKFRAGSDSSRGKKYFYDHGAQFLVQVPPADLPRFTVAVKKRPEIFEAYAADWNIQKD